MKRLFCFSLAAVGLGAALPLSAAPAKAPLPTVLLYPASSGDVAALVDLRTRLRLDGKVEVLTYDPESAAIQRASTEDAHPEWLVSAPATDEGRMVLARALGASFYAVVSPGRAADTTHVELVETAPAARTFDWTGTNRQFGVRAMESQVADSVSHPVIYATASDLTASVPAPSVLPTVTAPPASPVPVAAAPVPAFPVTVPSPAPPVVAAVPVPLPPVVAAAPVPALVVPVVPAPPVVAAVPTLAPPMPVVSVPTPVAPAPVAVASAPIRIALPAAVPPPAAPLPLLKTTPVPLELPAPVVQSVPVTYIPAPLPQVAAVPMPAPMLTLPTSDAVPLPPVIAPPERTAPPLPKAAAAPLPKAAAIPPQPAPVQVAALPKREIPTPTSALPRPFVPEAAPPQAPVFVPTPVPVAIKKHAPPAEDITAIEPLLARGDSALDGGDAVSAIALYREAINGAPLSVVPRLKLAQAYQQDGLSDRALDEARRALEIAPDSAPVQQFLMNLDQQSGTTAGSLIRDRAALQRSPTSPAAHAALADALWNNGDLGGAEAEYKAASALAPAGSHLADAQLAQLYAAEARYGDCLAILQSGGKDSYAVAIQIVKNRADTLSSTLASSRETFAAGKSTREQFYDDAKKLSAQAQALAQFVAEVSPPAQYNLSHLHRVLSTNLLAQEAATLVTFIETGDSRQSDSLSLLERGAATEMLTAQATEEKLGLWKNKLP